ncbi:MAG TPA: hypothetical protein VKZ50_14805 [bacterium]|nr:hypothetical protein [bacterium]
MAPAAELVRYGNWRYLFVADETEEHSGRWNWLVIRLPIGESDPQVVGKGQADSMDEAERLAGLTLSTEWEYARVTSH